jgi:hypothetical protein
MTQTPDNKRERCEDLLIQASLHGLDTSERQELDDLIELLDISDKDRFDFVVGAIDAALHEADLTASSESLPDHLRSQIITDAGDYIGDRKSGDNESVDDSNLKPINLSNHRDARLSVHSGDSVWSTREIVLTFVTAASLMFALASFSLLSNSGFRSMGAATSVEAQLAALREDEPSDLRVVSWTNPTDDGASKNASGKVIWSDDRQSGFMVFEGLEVNDPKVQQYQLWIFDKSRDDTLPVDGGVFDIAATGKVIVPIDAKLSISEATMFAVTIEQPGGVVQSKRERLPLLAKVVRQ